MVTRSRLRLAIAAEKGIDFTKLKREKRHKAALKRKKAKGGQISGSSGDADHEDELIDAIGVNENINQNFVQDTNDGSGEESGQGDEEMDERPEFTRLNLDAVDDSDTSESSIDLEDKLLSKPLNLMKTEPCGEINDDDVGEGEEREDNDTEDVPVSDLEDLDEDDVEDLIPHTRLTINNTAALQAALDRISVPTHKHAPFALHQSVVASVDTADSIPDVSDDLQRELAFYSQCLDAARYGRSRLLAEGVPFSRPKDYFAEMIKEDAHMEKVKAKLVEEASAKKAAAEARKLRDLKKFGKQVQVAKLQERQKAKRETLEKIKTLKRKRQEAGAGLGTSEADMFDVGVDTEMAKYSHPAARAKYVGGSHLPNNKRQKKNERYGFGGKKRYAKSGDAISSGDLSGFDAKRMKAAGAKSKGKVIKMRRPGKARRRAVASR